LVFVGLGFSQTLLEVDDATGLWEGMPSPERQPSNLVIPYDGPGWNNSWLTYSTIFEVGAQGQGLWTGNNYIAAGSTTEESVYFDLGFPQTVTEIRLYRNQNAERFPKRIQVMQGGTYGDTTGWTEVGSEVTLDESDIPTACSPTNLDHYSLDISDTPFTGQYLRLSFRGNFGAELGGNFGKMQLAAVQFYGATEIEEVPYSLEFDGGDDYIEVPHNSSLDISQTGDQYYGSVMAWVNLNYSNLTEDDWPRIVSKKTSWDDPEGFELQVNPYSNVISLIAGDGNMAEGTLLHQDGWVHIAATFDNWQAKIYFNGVDVTTDGGINRIESNTESLWIGSFSGNSDPNNGCCWTNGFIDDVALYNVELTQEQIQQIISNGITVDQTVAAYWNFNEGSGSTVVDRSFNSNNGTVYGAAWSDSVFTIDVDGILNVPDEYSTIQSAINAAIDGQTVQVAAGTYVENINFNGKNISVIGADQATTIIDGDSTDGLSVVMFRNGETRSALLQNFTITNGNANNGSWPYSDDGGGILINEYSSPTLRNLTVTSNHANDHGGGVTIDNYSDPLLDNVTINQNSTAYGGGLYVSNWSNPEIKNTIISNNTATGDGGGVYTRERSNPTFDNVQITDNTTNVDGGGAYINIESDPIFENVQITDNTAGSDGGGVWISGSNSDPLMNNMVISNNSASGQGGGIWVTHDNGSPVLTIHSSTISNNSASSGGGIGNYGCTVNVSYTTISGNTTSIPGGTQGGGFYGVGGILKMDHVEITDNTSASYGGGLYSQTTNLTLNHITISDNTANSSGGGLATCCNSVIDVENSIFFNNSPQEFQYNGGTNTINVFYSNISGGQDSVVFSDSNDSLYWAPGNIDVDPFFADTANGDYSLLAGSQCIDAGDPDADGDSITWETDYDDRDPDMTRLDMGSYFFNQDETIIPTYAFSFDGQDDYARVSSDLYGNLTEATFAWYVKTGNNSTDLALLGQESWDGGTRGFFLNYTQTSQTMHGSNQSVNGGFHLYNAGNNNGDNAQNLSYPLEQDTYYYIVMVFNGTEKKFDFYVDGNFIGSLQHAAWSKISNSTMGVVEIGANSFDNFYAEQKLAEFRVWNRALTPWEVQAHLDVDYATETDGLIGHWDFDEGQGGIAYDLTSNANHITLYNGTDWTLDTPQQTALPEFFSPVAPTGLPYHVVADLEINNTAVNLGTEVALFDGELCVGATIYNNTAPGTFTGEYYSAPPGGVYSDQFGELVLTRQDSVVGFNGSEEMDLPSDISDQFQIKWTGSIYAPTTRNFQFYQSSAGGMRLYVDGIQLVDRWNNGNNYEYVTIALVKGFHSIEVHFASNSNAMWNYLDWDLNGYISTPNTLVRPVDPTPSISVTAWEGNTDPYIQGFTAGNPITAKVRSQVYGTWLTLDAATAAVVGDGNFGTDSYAVISLDASTTDFPVIAVSPASIDFGALMLGNNSSQYVSVTNTGTAPLDVSLVTTSDSQFSISGFSSNVLTSGASTTITVTYTPTEAMSANAQLTIFSDDPSSPIETLQLIGQGLPMPVAGISIPSSLDFGTVETGGSQELQLQVFNTGSATLNVTNMSVTGDAFSMVDTTGFSVEPGSETTFPITFAPQDAGTLSGQLILNSNAENVSQSYVSLSGYGYDDYFNPVAPTGLPYTIVVDSIVVDDHSLSIGDQVAVFEYDESNDTEMAVGSAVYTGISGISSVNNFTGFTGDAHWSVSNTDVDNTGNEFLGRFGSETIEYSISGLGSQDNIHVSFDLYILDSWDWETWNMYVDGELIISRAFRYNEPGEGSIYNGDLGFGGWSDNIYRLEYIVPHSANDITVSFTGYPNESIDNESWGIDNFSCVPYMGSSAIGSSLSITAWEADPDNGLLEGFTAGSPMSFKIYAAVYDSMMEMIPDVTLLVGDENFGTGQFTVVQLAALSGVDPIIRLDQTSMVFPTILVNETAVDTVYIYNDGLSALVVSSAAIETGSSFSVGQSSFTIAAESSFALPVFFTPTEAMPYNDVLTITSDDPDNPTKTIALLGQGLPVTAGELFVPSASVNFPATVIGETSTVTVPLFNSGSGALVVDSVSLQNNTFSAANSSFIISSGVTHNLTLQFTPDTVGSNQTILLFYTDSQISPAANRYVYGTGYEGFFNVVEPTGLPYTVVVDSLVGPLDSIQAGDEIGIFDGSICVGNVVIDNMTATESNTSAMYFQSDYATTDNNTGLPVGNEPRTMSLWFRTTQGGEGFMASYGSPGGNYSFGLFVSGGEFRFSAWGNDINSSIWVNDDQWHHAAITHDESSFRRLYLDGVEVGSDNDAINTTSGTRFNIAQWTNSSSYFDGSVDEIAIWNRALSADEVQINMNSMINPGTEYGLVGYWDFEEGSGEILYDRSGNDNNTNHEGGTWITDIPELTRISVLDKGDYNGNAWQADPDNSLNGFTPGNPLSFRYFARRDNVATIYEASHIALTGDGNFGTQPFSVVEVTSSSTESIYPTRITTLSDLAVVEDSGPNDFSISFNNYFIHPFDPLEFVPISIDSSAVIGTTNGTSTTLTITPQQDWFGTTNLIIGAFDGYFYAYDTIAVTISPVNDAPVVASIPDSVLNEDESFTFDLDRYTIDVDNDSSEITYTSQVLSGIESNAVITINDSTHIMSVAATPDSAGTFLIEVTAMDDSSAVGSDTFQVVILPINDAPFIVSPIPDKRIYRSTGIHMLVNDLTSVFIDKENDQLFFNVSAGSDSVTTIIQGTRLSVNLLADIGSVEEIIVTSTDGQLTTADTFNLAFVQWAVRISAANDSAENNNNFIGVAAQATVGHDPDFEQLVDDENELSVYFEHSDWLPDSSAYFDQDIRSLIALDDTSHAWTFDVISAAAADVSLNFSFYDYPGFPAKVVDLETGEEQPLNQDTEILFTAQAAESRSFQVYVGDVVSPAAVTDLAVDSALSKSMILQWSAPGDNGLAGMAVSYEIRYSLESITSENFTNAILVTDSVLLPDSSGQLQSMGIVNLEPQTEYYFAIKTTDDAGNQSLISNIINQSTLPVPLTDLNAYWGKFHNNLLNSGYTSYDGASLDTLLWYYETNGEINSPPVIDDRGEIYFGSEDGSVYALKVDGTLKWSYDTGGGVTAAPLASTLDRLYVGSKNSIFYCLNRSTGDTIWTYQANDQIYSSATIDSSGRLFFADLDGQVYCLDSEFGTLHWQTTVGNRIYSTPAFSPNGSIIYVGGFDKNVYALDAATGSVLWNYATSGYILSSMAVDEDGVIYISSSDRKLYALNPDGSLKWSYTTGGAIWYSSPALGTDNDVYIGSDDNKLYSVNRSDGTLRWTYTTNGDIRNSPAVAANGYIYFGSMDNSLYQVDTSGSLVSSVQFGDQIQTSSVGIGAGGIIYIGTHDNRLYSYGVGDTIPPITPAELSTVSSDHNVILSWSANEEPDMSYYNIYRSVVAGFDPSPSDSLTQAWKTTTSYTDSAVMNGVTYYYRMKAIDITGNFSLASAEVVGTPTDLPPAVPTELAADAGDSRITLNWTAGAEYDLAGHIIYRNTDSTFVPTSEDSIATIPLPEISFVDSGLVTGVAYYYQLAAYDTSGNVSLFSDQVLSVPLDLTAPSSPEGIVVQHGDGQVTLTWIGNTESDLDLYQLYLNTDSSFIPTSSDLLASISAPAVAYTDTGLINGFIYYYLITALDTTGNESAASRLIIGTPVDQTPPAAPTGLATESGDHFVDLTWISNVEYDLSYYIIYRSELEDFEAESHDSLTSVSKISTSFRDTSVTNGVTYYYRLKAGDLGHNIGPASDAVIGTPIDLPPAAPTEFAAVIGDGRITLNWLIGSEYDLVGHIIYRSNDSTFVPTRDDSIAVVLLPEISYVDSGLVTGLTYYYRLSSYDLGGNTSLISDLVFGAPVDLTAPLTPQDIVLLNGEKQVTLTWSENTEPDLDRYHLYRNSDSSFVPTSSDLLASITPSAVTYTDTGLSNGYSYYYLLTAIDTTGNESAASELLTGTPTDLTPPATILDLEVVNFTSNTIQLQWTATGGDSIIGKANAYDMRFSLQALSEANFDEADSVTTNVPNPGVPGTLEDITVTGLDPNTLYFFAVKAIDSTGNESAISNMVFQETAETPTLLSTSLWGKFHYDNQNTGRSPINGTDLSTVVWSYETGDAVNSSPVLDDRGDVYFGSEDGFVYALNVDGTLKWSYDTGYGVNAAPVVTSMDRLYVGSKSGVFYCFNRTTGDTIWTYTASDEIFSSAVINDNGRLFFGDQDGNLTCLDSEFGTLYWEVSVGNRIYSSPALSPDDSTLYVGGHDKKVYALDVLTGEEQWNYSTNGYILSSMAVDEDGVIYASSYDRKLYAINPNGTLKWTYSTSGAILYSSPAFGTDNDIYIGSNDNKLHSVNRSDGSLRWKYSTSGDIRNSPAVTANGNIYFGSTDKKIYAVDQNGNLAWNYTTTDQILTSSAAIGPNGNVYIGSSDNYLYLIGELDTIPPSIPSNFIANPGDERVIMSWDTNPENDLSRYVIYKGLTAENVQLYDSVGFAYNTFVDSSLENNIEYFYSLKAVDQLGNRSLFSPVASATPYDQTPPPAPSGLTAVPGDSEISLSWDPLYNVSDFLNYRLYVMAQDSSFTVIDSTIITDDPISDAQDTEIFLSNLQNKTTYHFSVTAVDTFLNESEYSTIVSSTPYAGPVWYVSNDGDNNNIGYITDPFLTIEYAIDYASDDDTVMVVPGTYMENIIIDGKSIVLSGLGNPENIIIDGNQAGTVVNIVDLNFSGISVAVENMTITNGNSEKGGGIFVEEVSVNLDRLIISGNNASVSGGGVFIQGLGGILSNMLFVDNSALNGAGLATEGWADVSVWNSTINGNIASNTGGGIYCTDNSVVQVINCIISDNDSNEVAVGSSTEPGSIQIDYSNIAGGETDIQIINGNVEWGSHNFDFVENPFYSRSNNDFSLSDFSSLMGKGFNDLGLISDLYGSLRPNPIGSNPDLGAIESTLASQRPKSGAVFDGGPVDLDWFSDSTIIAHWESFIDDSTVSYQISVGTHSDSLENVFSWTNAEQDTFFTMNLTSVTSGVNYYVSVRGLDIDNQMSDTTTSNGFVFDFVPPTVTNIIEVKTDIDMDFFNDSTNLNFTWSGNDNESGLDFYEYALGLSDSLIMDWSSAGIDTTAVIDTFAFIEGETYYFMVRSIDIAGNVSSIGTGDGFLIDYTSPTSGLVFDGMEDDISYSGSDSTVNAHWSSFDDSLSGIDYYEYAIGNSVLGSDVLYWTSGVIDTFVNVTGMELYSGETYYISIRAVDYAGNISSIVSSNGLIVDTEPPGQGFVNDGSFTDLNWYNQDTSLTVFWTGFSDELSGVKDYTISIGTNVGLEDVMAWTSVDSDSTATFDGLELAETITYYFNIIANDSVGNEGTVVSSNGITIDLAAPSTFMNLENYYIGPDRWNNENPLVGTADDDLSGVQSIEIMIIRKEDNFFWSEGGWTLDSNWVKATGDTSWNYQFTLSNLGNGQLYRVYAHAVDSAGNKDPTHTLDSLVYDSSLPESFVQIEQEFYNDLSWNVDSSITGTAMDSISGIDSVLVAVERLSDNQWFDGTQWQPFELWQHPLGMETWYFQFTENNLIDSVSYNIYSKAFDLAGNQQLESGSSIFTYDISIPATGQVYDGSESGNDIDWSNIDDFVSAFWTGFDDIISGISQYEYMITEESLNTIVPWTSVGVDTFVVDTSLSFETGMQYFVNVRATDGANNLSLEAMSDGVTVDTIAPVIIYIYEGSFGNDLDFQYDNSSLSVAWGGSDSREISKFLVSLGSAPGLEDIVNWVDVSSNLNHVFDNLNLEPDSTYFANVKAFDQAGNISGAMSGDGITVDQTVPDAGLIADFELDDVDWTAIDYQILAFLVGFSDSLSGVAEYWVSIGLSPGLTQVLDWTSNGSNTSFAYVVELTPGPTYYVNAYAIDAVGNVSATVSSDGFGVDLDSPVAGTVFDGQTVDLDWTNNDSTLSANWSGFSDATSSIANYEYSIGTSVGSENITQWTLISGSLITITQDSLSLAHGTTYFFNLHAYDEANNVSQTIYSNGITLDTELPIINQLTEGSPSNPIYQASDDSLSLYCNANDNLSGINLYKFAVGSTVGDSDVVDWTTFTSENSSVIFDQLVLNNGSTYYGQVRVIDQAGNLNILEGDGVIIDATPPSSGTVIDLTDLSIFEDQDITNSISTLSAFISGFNDTLSGIDRYEYSVGTSELNTDVKDWSLTENDTLISDNTLSLEHTQTYYISVRAFDVVGNISSPISSNGITLDEFLGPPVIESISIEPGSWISSSLNTVIDLQLSEPIQNYDVSISAMIESGYTIDTVYTADPPQIQLTLVGPFAALDTVTFGIHDLTDLLGFEADTQYYFYKTPMIGDYNTDNSVDILDLNQFVIGWQNQDYSFETGPVTGVIPNYIPNINSVFDLRDVMAFTRMWHWSNNTPALLLADINQFGPPLDIKQSGKILDIVLTDDVASGQVLVIYDQTKLEVENTVDQFSQNILLLKNHSKEVGNLLIEKAYLAEVEEKHISLETHSFVKEDAFISIQYIFLDRHNNIIAQGFISQKVIAVPDEFALHQNYPNPFNPVTTIQYDLPQESHVNLVIYDLLGREVKTLLNNKEKAGYQSIRWNGRNNYGQKVSAGMYFYKFETSQYVKVNKMILLK